MLVGAYAGHDDDVLLASLESINRCNFDFLVQLAVQTSLILHVLHKISTLALVRCDHADLLGT